MYDITFGWSSPGIESGRRHAGGEHHLIERREIIHSCAFQLDVDTRQSQFLLEAADRLVELRLPGTRFAKLNWPPTVAELSKSVTSRPRRAAVVENAGRRGRRRRRRCARRWPPGVEVELGLVAGARVDEARGAARLEGVVKHAWLHAMHVLISSSRSAIAFVSRMDPRGRARHRHEVGVAVSEHLLGDFGHVDPVGGDERHADPASVRSLCVTHEKPARGTEVAIAGMRASCHPIPVLITSAPAASSACASATTSGHSDPSSTRSII